jgi:hypothetical protein
MPSKFPVSDWEPGDHMSLGREMIGSGRRKENVMTGRRTMMVFATALLAGSLLATGAQARGGGGGGGHGGGGGFSAGSMGGFGGGHVGGFGGGHMAGFRGSRMADMGRDHYGFGRRGYGGYSDYDSCPYYTSNDWPYTCTY